MGLQLWDMKPQLQETKSWLWDKAEITRKSYNFENLSCNYEKKSVVRNKAAIPRNKVVIMR